jgi:hypothetical protein
MWHLVLLVFIHDEVQADMNLVIHHDEVQANQAGVQGRRCQFLAGK